jgi:hypothetical protein
MSDIPVRKLKTVALAKPTVERSNTFSTECADGFVYSIGKEVTSLSFYIERPSWNTDKEGKPNVAGISREILIEFRLPTSEVNTLATHLIGAIASARKDGKYPRIGPLPE